jgi:hypothetical protein
MLTNVTSDTATIMLATNKHCNFHYVKHKNMGIYFDDLKIPSKNLLQLLKYKYLELLVNEKSKMSILLLLTLHTKLNLTQLNTQT